MQRQTLTTKQLNCLDLQADLYKLLSLAIDATTHFDKQFKYTAGTNMILGIQACQELVDYAYCLPENREHYLRKLTAKFHSSVELMLRLCRERRQTPKQSAVEMMLLTDKISQQIKGWLKATMAKRAKSANN